MPTENIDTLPVEWAIADKCGAYCLWLLWIGWYAEERFGSCFLTTLIVGSFSCPTVSSLDGKLEVLSTVLNMKCNS